MPMSVAPLSPAIQPRFDRPGFTGRRKDAINPSPRDTTEEIWEQHKDDWKRLLDEEGLYVWQARASYHYVTVRVEARNKRFGLLNPSEESVKEKIEAVLGDRYGEIVVKLEKAERTPLTKPSDGCCTNQCLGCNNGNPEKRLYLQG